MHPQWLKLSDGAWINMGNVNAVREDERGCIRLEAIGEHNLSPDQHRRISNASDIALVKAYLAQVGFVPEEAGDNAAESLTLVVGDEAILMRKSGSTATIDRATWESMSSEERVAWERDED
jgi:hypothetical protein